MQTVERHTFSSNPLVCISSMTTYCMQTVDRRTNTFVQWHLVFCPTYVIISLHAKGDCTTVCIHITYSMHTTAKTSRTSNAAGEVVGVEGRGSTTPTLSLLLVSGTAAVLASSAHSGQWYGKRRESPCRSPAPPLTNDNLSTYVINVDVYVCFTQQS
jgi:hypothetical protein